MHVDYLKFSRVCIRTWVIKNHLQTKFSKNPFKKWSFAFLKSFFMINIKDNINTYIIKKCGRNYFQKMINVKWTLFLDFYFYIKLFYNFTSCSWLESYSFPGTRTACECKKERRNSRILSSMSNFFDDRLSISHELWH